jgi:succinyl-CoA synthetase alpha subunit
MSILVNKDTRVVFQGITGEFGSLHARACIQYGTNVVAGVTPGRGGQRFDEKVPIYDTVEEAVKQAGADTSCIFVPPGGAADAIAESIDAGCSLVICITEGIPVLDMIRVRKYMEGKAVKLVGPNCPGVITPGECKIGIMPGHIHKKGHIGVLSKSGTLTYEAVGQLSALGIGQSTCVGIGGPGYIHYNRPARHWHQSGCQRRKPGRSDGKPYRARIRSHRTTCGERRNPHRRGNH